MVKKVFKIEYLLTVIVVALMIGAAEISGEKEIIFPEVTAITVGMLISPNRAWRVSRIRVLILISICSILGLLISLYSPLPLWINMAVGYLICLIILSLSGTGFAPLISATVLPIMLGTKSIIYPISAILLTLIILLFDLTLEKCGVKDKYKFEPKNIEFDGILSKFVLGATCIYAALKFDAQICVAPPLLVAFTELMNVGNKAIKKPFSTVLLITACAVAGAVSRYLISIKLTLPLLLSAIIATVLMIILINVFKMYLPPAGALTILPMLIPENSLLLYPVYVFVGICVFVTISEIVNIIRVKYKFNRP